MVHVNVGTANGLGPLIASSRGRVPILFSAGRTPVTEEGNPASRAGYIHWGQESFDQATMLREYVKWDYELRTADQLETVVDRALAMAMTEPKGPTYLTLPREVMAAQMESVRFNAYHRYDLPTFVPDPEKIREAAGLIANAAFPLIITSSAGRSMKAVKALVDLAETGAIAVVSAFPEYMNFPPEHPCYQGTISEPILPKADVILVIDSDVPWHPKRGKPVDSARIIQAGIDPLYSRYPIRGFPSDLTIQGEPFLVLSELLKALKSYQGGDQKKIDSRMKELEASHDEIKETWEASVRKSSDPPGLEFPLVSHQVRKILDDETIVVDEAIGGMLNRSANRPGSYFGSPHAGFLGWCLGAALGVKLGQPGKTVIATVGDGSYMFGVPSASHFVSNAYGLPILFIVYNNQCYRAVKWATHELYPDGRAAHQNRYPLSDLQPTADFEKICEAFGGYGERVESPDQVGPAIERALHAVRNEKRQALLNMVCEHP
jgi:acetolactate synthase-1/2/3 large subunit